MKRKNSKTGYINSLIGAFEITKNSSDEFIEQSDIYFTYFTPGFIVTGKRLVVDKFEANDMESLHEEMTQKLSNGGFSKFAIASVLNKFKKRDFLEEENTELYDEDKVIILEDVTIKTGENIVSYNTAYFVLFVDQIIGVIPAVEWLK